jgi:hypothetical protein
MLHGNNRAEDQRTLTRMAVFLSGRGYLEPFHAKPKRQSHKGKITFFVHRSEVFSGTGA